ncbi:MAG: 5'-deoxynucleotidase [Lachnospiraceae bacterium]|nr:5'-deoxynucleotidase [Lachnospiraceae bacterium]
MKDQRESHNGFFAMMARMKYIERWALMRNSATENISEHSMEVAMIAHALALLGNKRLGKQYLPEQVALLGLYHDCTEIITGDMPTPVKYHDPEIREAYKRIEAGAARRLLDMLPEDLRDEYRFYLLPEAGNTEEGILVKAADKLSALIKCIEEEKAGNQEFHSAKEAVRRSVQNLHCQEAEIFCEEFLPEYYKTIDELS